MILIMNRSRGIALVLALAVASGCAGPSGGRQGDTGTVRVVATLYPLAAVAAAVGGDEARVANLTPAGAEPHDVELTPDQVDRLEDADLVLFVGSGFQPAIERTVGRLGPRAVDALTAVNDLRRPEAQGPTDPHVWLDPHLMGAITDRVAAEMARARPPARDRFEERAAAYRAELDQLDRDFSTGLATCRRRVVVTAHEAFGYLGRRYGLEVRAIAGLDPESEPNPARVASVVDEIKALGVTTVFHEARGPAEAAETVAREAGVRTAPLDPLETLSRAAENAGDDYVSVMRRNLAALRVALECS